MGGKSYPFDVGCGDPEWRDNNQNDHLMFEQLRRTLGRSYMGGEVSQSMLRMYDPSGHGMLRNSPSAGTGSAYASYNCAWTELAEDAENPYCDNPVYWGFTPTLYGGRMRQQRCCPNAGGDYHAWVPKIKNMDLQWNDWPYYGRVPRFVPVLMKHAATQDYWTMAEAHLPLVPIPQPENGYGTGVGDYIRWDRRIPSKFFVHQSFRTLNGHNDWVQGVDTERYNIVTKLRRHAAIQDGKVVNCGEFPGGDVTNSWAIVERAPLILNFITYDIKLSIHDGVIDKDQCCHFFWDKA